jgi:hypothetical protein
MREKEQLLKKKPRKKNRFARFVLMLVVFIIIISLVFYSIENPSFIKNTVEKLKAFYDSAIDGSDTASSVDTFSAESEGLYNEEAASGLETGVNGDAGKEAGALTDGPQTFWQKILAFLKRGLDKDNDNFPSSLEIKIYFASLGQEEKFSYEKRTIIAGSSGIAVENAVKELLEGPHKAFNFPVIPPGTRLKGVEVYENLAKIDLSQEFLDNSLESGVLDEYVIYTIVNTVTQIPGVDGVIFLIEGKRIKIYGSVDLSIPAIKDEDFISEDDPVEEYAEDLVPGQS